MIIAKPPLPCDKGQAYRGSEADPLFRIERLEKQLWHEQSLRGRDKRLQLQW